MSKTLKISSKEVSKESSDKLLLDNLLQFYLETRNTLELNQDAELEIKFGTRGIKKITKINFDNVIKQLLSANFRFKGESKYYLSIKSDAIRTEVIGIKNIQDYCKTNHLPSELSNDEYNFTEKKQYSTKDLSIYPVNFDDFNFRVSYNIETSLLSDSEKVRGVIGKWGDIKKFYRLINRFTMIHDDFPVVIDLSIVKESTKSDKKIDDIKDSNVFNNNEKYEIEIEVNNDLLDKVYEKNPLTSQILDKILKKVTKYVLSGLQETNYPISYSEQKSILANYLQLIKKENYLPSQVENINPGDFIGPSSITLQIINISPINLDEQVINIRENYTVTDKADGDRKLLYISSTGKIYLITTNMSVQFTGAVITNSDLFNSLIDGEHIKHNKFGQFINLYAAFDIYFINKTDVRILEFFPRSSEDIPTKFRLPILTNFIKDLNPVLLNTEKPSPIHIKKKRFYEVNDNQTIFDGCNTIQEQIKQGVYEYEIDGLIFTPMNFSVGSNKQGDQPRSHKVTWQRSLKWKPAEFNTIDFLITTKKLSTGAEFIGNIFQSGINTSNVNQLIQYKSVILRVGFDERKHGYINPCQNVIDDKIILDDDSGDNYKPVQFYPTNPYDPDTGVCYIPLKLDNRNEKQMFSEEGDIIEDNMIVEFRYDITREKHWQWIPLRIRYDKTTEYRSGQKNYGNAYPVAQSNWNSIHNPITLNMITSGNNIPNDLGNDDIYYNMSKDKDRKTSRTKALRDFHNLYVKNKLITSVTNVGDTLIDYAVGKGGDIPKWITAKLSFVFGIDLSRDNIVNRLDGVCARYLNYKKKYQFTPDIIPNALFIQGNTGSNIKNLSAQYTEKGKQITKAIFGEGPKDEKILGKGVFKSYGVASQGFNISSIQFAIHYMFENIDTVQNFLTNIAECTQLGGYFIGTSYDGKKIFEMLKDKKQGESVSILDVENNKLLEITKEYDRDEFPDNINCLGYDINVFQESINKTFREYLVNYDYFVQILENYGFVNLTTEEAKKINLPRGVGNFNELFDLMTAEIKKDSKKKNDYGISYKMTASERRISFLNKYFIFKKVRNVNINDINNSLTQPDDDEETQQVIESLVAQQDVKSVVPEPDVKAEVSSKTQSKTKAKTKKKLKLVKGEDSL